MYTYKLCKPFPPSNEVTMVRLNETNTFIPFDPNNIDYQAYLKWLGGYEAQFNSQTHQIDWVKTSAGNTPLPADE